MKKIVIAFDVDWTLIENKELTFYQKPNKRIIDLLKILWSFKNTKIIVWSWRWKDYAKQVINELDEYWYYDIKKYINWYASKNHKWKINWKHIFEPDIKPDICIDDIQDCILWTLNLIVKEK